MFSSVLPRRAGLYELRPPQFGKNKLPQTLLKLHNQNFQILRYSVWAIVQLTFVENSFETHFLLLLICTRYDQVNYIKSLISCLFTVHVAFKVLKVKLIPWYHFKPQKAYFSDFNNLLGSYRQSSIRWNDLINTSYPNDFLRP